MSLFMVEDHGLSGFFLETSMRNTSMLATHKNYDNIFIN